MSRMLPRIRMSVGPIVRLATLAALVVASLAPAGSSQASGLMSDNVEYIRTIPLEAGTWTTARPHEDYLYVSGSKSLSIYDISDPADPGLVSHTPTGVQFINEDIDTNGEILLLTDERIRGVLQVWDVSDKSLPVKLAELPDMIDHSFACVLDCKWAYGAGGDIVDLRDPANPKAAGKWIEDMPPLTGFDTTEVNPGRVITGSSIIHFLDGRRNPARPKVLALGEGTGERFIHSIRWPRRGRDPFLLVQSETSPKPRCDENSGKFMTWDATKWRRTHTFTVIDKFGVDAGTYADGRPAASALGCSPTWFREHPDFDAGGLVAVAFFDHGTRFLEVSKRGQISEVGYFMPIGGSTTASYWINDEIVYAIDIVHGIDVLRFIDEDGTAL